MSPQDPAAAIAASALAILADRGIKGLTVRAVAEAAGVSTTGIYTYFGGKQGLLDALFATGFEGLGGATRTAAGASPLERLRGAADRYRDWALANPTHYLLMFGARSAGYQPGPEAGEEGYRVFLDHVERVRAAIDDGALEGEAENLALHLWSTIHGYVMLEIAGPGPQPDDPADFYASGVDQALEGFAVRR